MINTRKRPKKQQTQFNEVVLSMLRLPSLCAGEDVCNGYQVSNDDDDNVDDDDMAVLYFLIIKYNCIRIMYLSL